MLDVRPRLLAPSFRDIGGLFLRDITGLSLRPRHLEVAWEAATGLPHPFLELDRGLGLEPPMENRGQAMNPFELIPWPGR